MMEDRVKKSTSELRKATGNMTGDGGPKSTGSAEAKDDERSSMPRGGVGGHAYPGSGK